MKTTLSAKAMSVLLLPSIDGPEWTHAVLFPLSWSERTAYRRAEKAIVAGQKQGGADWDWSSLESALRNEGFTIVRWEDGPTWDNERNT